jgi:hypothetical protein
MFTLFLIEVATTSDTVLLRHEHGGGADRHRDVISCAYDERADSDALFNAAQLLEMIVVPDALWCDGELRCHDVMSGKEFRGLTLECSGEEGNPVRCTLRVDCSQLIVWFWHSLLTTIVCILAFIIVPVVCFDSRPRRPALDYDKDTNL